MTCIYENVISKKKNKNKKNQLCSFQGHWEGNGAKETNQTHFPPPVQKLSMLQ